MAPQLGKRLKRSRSIHQNESLKNIWISIKDTDTTRAKDQKMNERMATVESKGMIDAYKNFATTQLSKLTRSSEKKHNQFKLSWPAFSSRGVSPHRKAVKSIHIRKKHHHHQRQHQHHRYQRKPMLNSGVVGGRWTLRIETRTVLNDFVPFFECALFCLRPMLWCHGPKLRFPFGSYALL